MRATITNRLTTFDATPRELTELKQMFSHNVPGARFSSKYRSGAWDGRVSLLRWAKVGTGLFLHKQKEIEAAYPHLEILDKRKHLIYGLYPFGIPQDKSTVAHKWQLECVEAMLKAGNVGGLVICATGTGKTFMAGLFFSRMLGPACFCVDELTLLSQARSEIAAVTGEEIGIVGRGEFDPRRITVATVQTLQRHSEHPKFKTWFAELEAVVIDEIHVALNRRSIEIVKTVQPKAVYGLTATLQLNKDEVAFPAHALTGSVVYTYALDKGQEEGILSAGRAVLLRYVHKVPNISADVRYTQYVVENDKRNQVIVDVAIEGVRRGRRVLILVRRLEHLARLEALLQGRDQPYRALSGSDPQEKRVAAIKAMDTGKVPLLLATHIFTKGVNIKTADVLINATADSSSNSTQQRLGRLARVAVDKPEFLYIDISDCAPYNGVNVLAKASAARIQALEGINMKPTMVRWENNPGAVYEYQQVLDLEKE